MNRFRRVRAIGAGLALCGLVAGASFVGTNAVLGTFRPDVQLIAGTDFAVSSTITAWPACPATPTEKLYPAVTRCLTYTVTNPLKAAIRVVSLNAVLDPAFALPAGCGASDLDLTNANLTGSDTTPILTVNALSSNTKKVAISLVNKTGLTGNQDACKNVTFHFKYTGSANYTEIYNTSTAVTSSANPSTVGQSVTYTATVTASATAAQDPVPSSPTGTVTFKDGSTTICTGPVTVTSTGTTTATAQCTPAAYGSVGSHSITATYANSDGNFTGSNAGLTQLVKNGTATALTSAPNPSQQGSSVTFTATVTKTTGTGTATGTVTFFTGTPATPGTNLGNGTLNSSGVATLSTSTLPAGATTVFAKYNGDTNFAPSTSPVITQNVIALPAACAPGSYNFIAGNPSSPSINGTNGNDFIYAPGATNWTINGGNGSDCIQAGDGNNAITDGNGNGVVLAGNGTNTITVGNGDNKVQVGNGAGNKITAGNGSNTVVMGTNANNTVTLGNGANTITIQTPGNHDTITVGNGKNTAFLGGGTFNKFTGGKSGNTCHLPSLPASTYNDTLTNCTAVTP